MGGAQLRPNIHMKDMVRAYELLLTAPLEKINGRIYNAGYENLTVLQIAELMQRRARRRQDDDGPSDRTSAGARG